MHKNVASSSSSSSSNIITTATATTTGGDKKRKPVPDEEPPKIPSKGPRSHPDSGVETAQNTVLHRCRFAKAMKDLEKSGIVRLRAGGTVVTRQIYTWISND